MNFLKFVFRSAYKILRPNLQLGKNVELQPCFVARGGRVEVGANSVVRFGTLLMPQEGYIRVGAQTTINHFCIINGFGGVEIGDDCSIAAGVAIFAHNHNFRSRRNTIKSQGLSSKGGVRIGDDVWIGTGAIILDGVTIGKGAVVAAGAVVTRDIEPYSIYAGNPARRLGERRDELDSQD